MSPENSLRKLGFELRHVRLILQFVVLLTNYTPVHSREASVVGDPLLRSLGGISLWDPLAPVLARLGKPIKIVEDSGAAFGNQYAYKGITLWAGVGDYYKVLQIEVTSPEYCTRSGVCPGTPAAEAQSKLGKPEMTNAIKEGKNSYGIAIEACWLEVVVAGQVVKSMAIRCQP